MQWRLFRAVLLGALLCCCWFAPSVTAEPDGRGFLALNMIIHDEAPVIERAIASVRDYVDRIVVVDTGSKDATVELVRHAAGSVPLVVETDRWVDFATNRNRAIELARRHARYVLFMDADDVFAVDGELYQFLAEHLANMDGIEHTVKELQRMANPAIDAVPASSSDPSVRTARVQELWRRLGWNYTEGAIGYNGAYMQLRYNNLKYRRIALLRTDYEALRYQGVRHEALTGSSTALIQHTLKVPYIKITGGGHRSEDARKYVLDALALEATVKAEPKNARAWFYLAQSYRDAGLYTQALDAYQTRVDLGGWREEVFWSLYQIALIKETDKAFAAAANYARRRAEPVFHRARLARLRHDYVAAYAFANYALQLCPEPDDALFVDTDIYRYGVRFERSVASYYVGLVDQFAEDNDALLKLGQALPEHWRAHVVDNERYVVRDTAE